MTKKFLSFVLTIACSILLGSCEKAEGLSVENCKLDMSLFSQTYTIDDEGCCVLKGAKPITSGEVQSEVVNYGWESIATYEVQSNGKLSQEEYWKDRFGGSPTNYWFESSQQLVQYFYMDSKPAFCFRHVSWSYDAAKGFILSGNDKLATADRYEQILKLGESNGRTLMYTMSKIAITSDGNNGNKPVYAMIVYKRLTDYELKKMKESYNYDLDVNHSVPDNCKFQIQAYDAEDGKNENNVFQTFRLMNFELTDENGINSSENAYYNYFDSITWTSDCRDMPDNFVIMRHKSNSMKTACWWSSYFFSPHGNTTIYANGYKDGRVVYRASKKLYLVNEGFFGYDWKTVRLVAKNPELTEYCLLDKSRDFVLTPPTAFNNDMNTPYAELRFVPKDISDKGDSDEYITARLDKEQKGLIEIMNQYYEAYEIVKDDTEGKHIAGKFKALPDGVSVKMYWLAKHSHMVLVLKVDKDEPLNSEYYVHAEPIR